MTSLELSRLIEHLLDEKKAENIVTLDLCDKGAIVDYMVIATATSGRQVNALASYIAQDLKDRGITTAVEGLGQSDWVLIDAGDVLAHVFKAEARSFYNLEKMWGSTDHAPSETPASS